MSKVTCSYCHTDNGERLVMVDGFYFHKAHTPDKTPKLDAKQNAPVVGAQQYQELQKRPMRSF